MDVEDDFSDKKLPTPEVGIWVRCGLIKYEFLSKPVSENTVLNTRTALWVRPSSLHYHRKWLGGCSIQAEDRKPGRLEDLTQRMVNSDHRPAYIQWVMWLDIPDTKQR